MRLSTSSHRTWAAIVPVALVLALVSLPSSGAAPDSARYSVDASGRPLIHNNGQAYLNAGPPVGGAGRRPARPDDAGGEGRPDDPGRARCRDRDPSPVTTWASAACCPAAARCPTPNTPEAWADMVDRFQAAALNTRLGIPLLYGVDSVHGHGNLLRRDRLPAQHRPRRHPRPAPGAADRHVTAEETRATGPQWSVRAVRLRGARRPLGPHLRELRRDPGAGRCRWRRSIDGLPGHGRGSSTTPTGCSPPPSTTPATATPTYGTGAPATTRSTRASTVTTARTSSGSPCRRTAAVQQHRRRLRDAVVLQRRLDRGRHRQPGQDARQPASSSPTCSRASWASTAS